MKRVGYDSDSGRYYFRDKSGVLYEGAQGAEFSDMTRGEFGRLSSHITTAEVCDFTQCIAHPLPYLKRTTTILKQRLPEQTATKRSPLSL